MVRSIEHVEYKVLMDDHRLKVTAKKERTIAAIDWRI
jgi:hypothetical protein